MIQHKSRSKDRISGLVIIALAFCLCTGASMWAKEKTIPKAAVPPAPRSMEEIAGFPEHVSPFGIFELAAARTERPLFVGMVAENVQNDGSLDFRKRQTKLKFVFQSPANMGAQPHREGGRLPDRSYCGKQIVSLTKAGLGETVDQTRELCGSRDPVALKLPTECSLSEVMALVFHGKKPPSSSSKVKVEYMQTKSGPAYAVSRRGKKKFTLLAADCKTMLKGKAARGHIP